MAGNSFRFLHASDFHLDQPLGGLTDIPDELFEPLIDAPYQAVDRVIDVALRQDVDFVVLTGDLIHLPTASPRAVQFLRTQLGRLHEKKIPTYWLGGQLEAGNPLPDDLDLPNSVHRIPSTKVHRLAVQRGKDTIAYIVGQSVDEHALAKLDELRCPRDGRFFVGLWYGDVQEDVDHDQLDELGIDYWAFGGRHNTQTLETTIPAHYSGTPQGRYPTESGSHGCVLVNVEENDVQTHFIETDVICYQTERLELGQGEGHQQLLSRITDRLHELSQHLGSNRHLLLSWDIVDDGPIGRELRRVGGSDRLLAQLQREQREKTGRNIANIGLRSGRASLPSSLFEEDTILGDFLRVVRDMEQEDHQLPDVDSYLPDTATAKKLAESLHLEDVNARRQLLREVAMAGIDMLSGE